MKWDCIYCVCSLLPSLDLVISLAIMPTIQTWQRRILKTSLLFNTSTNIGMFGCKKSHPKVASPGGNSGMYYIESTSSPR